MNSHFFTSGDKLQITHKVTEGDCAIFDGEMLHPVYSTFAIARDAEWACRQFVLKMKDENEEGIGTMLTVEHLSPAPIGADVIFTAKWLELKKNLLSCTFEASWGEKIIARGQTNQKILTKDRLNTLFAGLGTTGE